MNKSFTLYWITALFFIQFFFFTNSNDLFDVRQGRAVFFIFSVFIGLFIYGIKWEKLSSKYFLLAIMPLIAIFKMPIILERSTIFQLLCFIAGILLLFQVMTNQIELKILERMLAFTCILQSTWIIVNWFDFDFMQLIAPGYVRTGITGGVGNQGFTGGLICMTLPFLFKRKWYSPILIFIALLSIYVIHLHHTDTPIALAFFCLLSMLFFWIIDSKIKNTIIQWILFIFSSSMMIHYVDNVRWQGWRHALLLTNSWYGRGLGWIPLYFENVLVFVSHNREYCFRELHNEYLEAIIVFGPFALILFYFVLKAVLRPNKKLRNYWVSAMITMLYSISWHPFHLGTLSIVGILVFGVLLKNQEPYMEPSEHALI